MEPAAAGHVEHDDPDDREQGRRQPAVELQVEDQLRRDGRPLRRQDARCEPAREVLRGGEEADARVVAGRSEEHTSELQSQSKLVCRLLLEKKKSTSSS